MLQRQKRSQPGLKFEGSWNYDTTNKLITYLILPLLLLTVLPGESGLGSLVKKSKLFISQQCSVSYACTWELAKQSRIECSSRAEALLTCMRPCALVRAPGRREPQLNPLLAQLIAKFFKHLITRRHDYLKCFCYKVQSLLLLIQNRNVQKKNVFS